MRRVVDIALKTPGVDHVINIVGFSGATFTNAPNAGAMFLVLDTFDNARGNPNQSADAIQGTLFGKFAPIQEALLLVVQPPPVQGIGNAGGFRMMIEDRAGRAGRAAGRGLRDDGQGGADAGPGAGVHAVRDPDAAALSRYRPQQGAASRHQHAGRVQRAAGLYRFGLRQRLQPVRTHVPRPGAGGTPVSGSTRRMC